MHLSHSLDEAMEGAKRREGFPELRSHHSNRTIHGTTNIGPPLFSSDIGLFSSNVGLFSSDVGLFFTSLIE
jgi:hypothetical protein